MARFGPRYPPSQKTLAVGHKEALTRPEEAPEVTVESRLALSRTSMHTVGLTVETRLMLRSLLKLYGLIDLIGPKYGIT